MSDEKKNGKCLSSTASKINLINLVEPIYPARQTRSLQEKKNFRRPFFSQSTEKWYFIQIEFTKRNNIWKHFLQIAVAEESERRKIFFKMPLNDRSSC